MSPIDRWANDPARVRADLFDRDARRRRAAVRAVRGDRDDRYALRDVLLADADARVRADAAKRLGRLRAEGCAPWLEESLRDGAALVRDASLRAIARVRADASFPAVARLAVEDTTWSVRRTALLVAASLRGAGALDLARACLDDGFWRVRHAAVQLLASWGAENPSLRPRILARPEGSQAWADAARRFLAAVWSTEPRAPGASPAPRADDGLWNPDPAVIAARLERLAPDAVPPESLVEFLVDPHEALRAIAARRLRERGDLGAWVAASRWLDHPHVPHGVEAATRFLDGLRGRAEPVAQQAFLRGGSGAVRWAVGFALRGDVERFGGEILARASDANPRVRGALIPALAALEGGRRALEALAGDDDPAVRDEARIALCAEDPEAAVAFIEGASPRLLRACVDAAAAREDLSFLRGFAARDPVARAWCVAARGALGDLSVEARAQALADEDPLVRAAALTPSNAADAALRDPDPTVRRRATAILAHARGDVPAAAWAAWRREGPSSPDPWVRAQVAGWLDAGRPDELRALLALAADPDDTVRARAATRLHGCDPALDALLADPTLPDALRVTAWSIRARALDPSLLPALARDLDAHPTVRAQLAALSLLFDDGLTAAHPALHDARAALVPARAPRRVLAVGDVARNTLGRTGIEVAPLAISGAFDLPARALDRARERGVDLYFWEPGYRAMTAWLGRPAVRRSGARVITGSYHGSPDAVTRDVRRALRNLRRERLDVFLLFWTRDLARLSDEVWDALTRLKREGAIGAIGLSTHDRAIARAAIESGRWDVLMTRHSAAHPGAEDAVLPAARATGTAVLSFSALSYGRLLRPAPGAPEGQWLPTAAQCYRYVMDRPGVTACVAAPRRARELEHDLDALTMAPLDAVTTERMREHGRRVREANRAFNELVRAPAMGTLYPSAVLPEMLLEETRGAVA